MVASTIRSYRDLECRKLGMGLAAAFLRIAQGSVKELETHLLLVARKGLARQEDVDALLKSCEEVGKTVRGLYRSIQPRPS